MVGSVEASSVTLGVGFLLVGPISQSHPVGIPAKGIGLEDPNMNFPQAIGLALDSDPAVAEFGGSVGSGVFHTIIIARFRRSRKGSKPPQLGRVTALYPNLLVLFPGRTFSLFQ